MKNLFWQKRIVAEARYSMDDLVKDSYIKYKNLVDNPQLQELDFHAIFQDLRLMALTKGNIVLAMDIENTIKNVKT